MSIKDIPIGIEIKVDDSAYNETIQRLANISVELEKIGTKSTQVATKSVSAFSDEIKDLSNNAEEASKKIAGLYIDGKPVNVSKTVNNTSEIDKQNKAKQDAINQEKKHNDIISKINNTVVSTTPSYLTRNEAIIAAGKAYGNLNGILEDNKDRFETIIKTMKTYAGDQNDIANGFEELAKDGINVSDSEKRIAMSFNDLDAQAKATGKTVDELAMSELVFAERNKIVNGILSKVGLTLGGLDKTAKTVIYEFNNLTNGLSNTKITNEEMAMGMLESQDALDRASAKAFLYNKAVQEMSVVNTLSSEALEFDAAAMNLTVDEYKKLAEKTNKASEAKKKLLEEIERNNLAFQEYKVKVGQVGEAYKMLANAGLWVGLSFMFSTMSLNRALTSSTQVQSATLSLRKALMSERDTADKLTEAIGTYGKTSREAMLASFDMEDATLNVKLSQDKLKDSIINSAMVWVQYFTGMVPTVFAASFQMASAYMYLQSAKKQDTSATIANSSATTADLGPKTANISLTNLLASSNMKLAMALSLVTMGLNVAIGLGAYAIASSIAEKETKKLNEQLAKLPKLSDEASYSLVGGSLVPDIEKLGNTANKATSKVLELNNANKELSEISNMESYEAINDYNKNNIKSLISKNKSNINDFEIQEGNGKTELVKTLKDIKVSSIETSNKLNRLNPIAASVYPLREMELNNRPVIDKLSEASTLLDEIATTLAEKHTLHVAIENTPEIGQELGNTSSSGNNQIIINGPWYVREEADIDRISNAIETKIMKKYFSQRGRY